MFFYHYFFPFGIECHNFFYYNIFPLDFVTKIDI